MSQYEDRPRRVSGAMAKPEVATLSSVAQERLLKRAFVAAEAAGEEIRIAKGHTAWTDEEIDAAAAVLRQYLLGAEGV